MTTAAPGRLRHPPWGHYADFPPNKITRVLEFEGRSMPRLGLASTGQHKKQGMFILEFCVIHKTSISQKHRSGLVGAWQYPPKDNLGAV